VTEHHIAGDEITLGHEAQAGHLVPALIDFINVVLHAVRYAVTLSAVASYDRERLRPVARFQLIRRQSFPEELDPPLDAIAPRRRHLP
jgi:hypothetical protein